MFKRFYPTYYYESVQQIDYDDLLKQGKTSLIFDLDNTLAPFDVVYPDDNIISFISGLKEKGFKVALVSNNKGNRVEIFNEKLGLPVVSKAGKPKLGGITKAIDLMDTQKEKCVMIGDQMFTDVWVGNRLGITSILVKPIANRDEFTVKLKRGAEKKVFKRYQAYDQKNSKK